MKNSIFTNIYLYVCTDQAIAEAKELEAHMQSAMLTIGETCGQAHEKYLAFVHTIEATNFPFIVSASAHLQENPLIESLISGDGGLVNKELFLSIPSKENDNISNDFVENKLWADVEGGILKSLRELQAQWEENGVVTESVRLLEICLGIIMWADAVRKVITSVNWGDIKRFATFVIIFYYSHYFQLQISYKVAFY